VAKARGPVQREAKEVMAELVAKLKERLEPNPGQASSGPEPYGVLRPNLSGLTVGVDLGDKWSSYCIVGLEGETLTEGKLKTTQEDVAALFQTLTPARVVMLRHADREPGVDKLLAFMPPAGTFLPISMETCTTSGVPAGRPCSIHRFRLLRRALSCFPVQCRTVLRSGARHHSSCRAGRCVIPGSKPIAFC
jgi:hypothetical protein